MTNFEYYKDKSKLNEDERKLCELFKRGLICRDYDGELHVVTFPDDYEYDKRDIRKGNDTGNLVPNLLRPKCYTVSLDIFRNADLKFDFVTWKDGPWDIRELLKLDVDKEESEEIVNKCSGCININLNRISTCLKCKRGWEDGSAENIVYEDLYKESED